MASSRNSAGDSTTHRSRTRAAFHCSAHPEADLIEDSRSGDLICSQCGLVVGDRVLNACWTDGISSEELQKLSSASVLLSGMEEGMLKGYQPKPHLGTFIEPGYPDYRSGGRRTFQDDPELGKVYWDTRNVGDKLGVPAHVSSRACVLYEAYRLKVPRIRKHLDSASAACFYIACREFGYTRTFKEIADLSEAKKTDIAKCFRAIVEKEGLVLEKPSIEGLFYRVFPDLDLSSDVQRLAIHIGKKAVNEDLVSGRKPMSIVAASIYMAARASGLMLSQEEVGAAASVCPSSVSQYYCILCQHEGLLFPPGFVPQPDVLSLL